jgi:hypothetical protein
VTPVGERYAVVNDKADSQRVVAVCAADGDDCRAGDKRIVYIGEGMIRSRLAQHRKSASAAGSRKGKPSQPRNR